MYPSPSMLAPVLDLYSTTWPRLPDRIATSNALGWVWQDASVPFVAWADGPDGTRRALSHVGLLPVPLRIAGQDTRWAALHAVCTRPTHRSQGLSRPLMQAALDHIDRSPLPFAGTFLTTDQPALYTRYGFRVVPEHRFRLAAPPRAEPDAPRARPLAASHLEDVHLLRRILLARRPLSERLAARDSGWLTALGMIVYCGDLSRFHYLSDLDAVVAAEVRSDGVLCILDVACARPLSLPQLCDRLPSDYHTVELQLCAEHLVPDADCTPVPVSAPEEDTFLMVRGAWPLDGIPAAMPPLSRC